MKQRGGERGLGERTDGAGARLRHLRTEGGYRFFFFFVQCATLPNGF